MLVGWECALLKRSCRRNQNIRTLATLESEAEFVSAENIWRNLTTFAQIVGKQ